MSALPFPAAIATKFSLRLWIYTNIAGTAGLIYYFTVSEKATGMYSIGILGGICGALFSAPTLPFLIPAMRWVLIESDGLLRFFRLLGIIAGLSSIALGTAALFASGFTPVLLWLASPYLLSLPLIISIIYRRWLFRSDGTTISLNDGNA